MSVSVADLQSASTKKRQVILNLVQEDGSLEEVEGRVEAASEAGVAFKPKGSSNLKLLVLNEIEDLALVPEKPKPVTQKKLKPIEEDAVRQHLADRHGISREWCNNATEKQAFDFHESLDHDDLGHRHEAPKDEAPKDEAKDSDEGNDQIEF